VCAGLRPLKRRLRDAWLEPSSSRSLRRRARSHATQAAWRGACAPGRKPGARCRALEAARSPRRRSSRRRAHARWRRAKRCHARAICAERSDGARTAVSRSPTERRITTRASVTVTAGNHAPSRAPLGARGLGHHQWTRLQPIGTVAEVEVTFAVFTHEPFRFQEIAGEVERMRRLGGACVRSGGPWASTRRPCARCSAAAEPPLWALGLGRKFERRRRGVGGVGNAKRRAAGGRARSGDERGARCEQRSTRGALRAFGPP
jgi:hypothetical protein